MSTLGIDNQPNRLKRLQVSILRWFMLPDLVASRIACALSNLLWAMNLAFDNGRDPFAQVMDKILPIELWVVIFAVLAIGQVALMVMNKTHTAYNFALVTVQTTVWIFLTAIFYREFYPGSLILANSTLIAILSSWTFIRTDTCASDTMKRWGDR